VYCPNLMPTFPQYHAMCHIIHDGGGANMIQVVNNTDLTLSFAANTLSATQISGVTLSATVKVIRIF
jgi:hypothetical protein